LFVLLALVPASGPAREAPWNLPALLAALAQPKALTVRFSEQRHLQYLTEPLRLEGTLSFDPPDRLEKHVLRPKRERMTVEGELITVETNPRDPRVRFFLSDYPALGAFVAALRATLNGDAETLERIFLPAMDGTEDSWSLRLTPRMPEVRGTVSEIRIGGSAGRITSIDILEAGGDRSIIAIHEEI
jgi:hypothetical protein